MKQFLRSNLLDFAGIVVFYALLWTVGLKAAIAGTIVFLFIDAIRRWKMKLGFPRIYLLSGAMAVGFGAIDLYSTNPFMIKYEAVVTSLALAVFFALGARGKSIIQELVEQRDRESFEAQPDTARFFQLLTLLWAAYFVLKAIVYLWIGETVPIERAMAIRPVIGTASLVAMVLVMTQSERMFTWCNRLGWLPHKQDTPARS